MDDAVDRLIPPGSVVNVRGRRWLVEGTEAIDSELPVVHAACIDDDAQGEPATFIWDAEVAPAREADQAWECLGARGIDRAETFAAYLQTVQWSTATAADRRLFQAPFRAGIRLSAYQLAPLEKALSLPRVNLLIADDVGLGKTVEAGLIVRELLLRRRLDLFVVAAPPAMTLQWQDELATKFGISTTLVDREWVAQVRRRRGFQANPWATGAAFILSHRLLIEEGYVSGLRGLLGAARPRTLLVVDEAHHAAPASGSRYAIDSQLTRALRDLAPRFEHRLFLTATPHNGHSNSFAALLEILDPQRFTRGIPVEPRQLDLVMVRRLKSDLREMGEAFPERVVEPIRIRGLPADAPELVLARRLAEYGELRELRLARLGAGDAQAARLVFSGLQQRLLSSVAAFAKTLRVHRASLASTAGAAGASRAAAEAFAAGAPALEQEETREADTEQLRIQLDDAESAATTAAATHLGAVQAEAAEIAAELSLVDEMLVTAEEAARRPDARVRWSADWIRTHLKDGATWCDRRLIVFTEFEDTRRWLETQLLALLDDDPDAGRIRVFSGATPPDRREEIKLAFNADPAQEPVRILLCTDAAREGINLQTRCHNLIHFDLPWNPSRLEQRNGRIDRKLQPEPRVYCRYFLYEQRETDVVLETLVEKTEVIRAELGAIGQVIEERILEQLQGGIHRGQAVRLAEMLAGETGGTLLERAQAEMEDETVRRQARLAEETDRLRNAIERSRRRVGVDAQALAEVAHAALERVGARAEPAAPVGPVPTFALDPTQPAFAHDSSWGDLLDELRERPRRRGERLGDWRSQVPLRRLAFAPPVEADGRDAGDVAQLHLEHRLIRRLLGRFQAQGFQAGLERVCVLLSDEGRPRVLLLGRICLYGPGATRLHEEIIPVAALWHEKDRDRQPLKPLKEKGEAAHVSLKALNQALRAARPAPAGIETRLAAFAADDAAALRPELETRAMAAAEKAAAELTETAQREAQALASILQGQRDRIAAGVRGTDQLSLELEGEEQRQRERDRAHWQQRLTNIEREIADEPAQVIERYSIKARRIEPIGVVYLWPATG